ncbi:MAG: hypothetical protein H7Y04_04395 [Verrucomicrobia bacterium]|nr:hypothetical protein [Cytophagales bacterium]
MDATEIFAQLLAYLKMNVREFALSLGYDRAENFYNIQRGKSAFQYETLKLIVKKYPDINPDWLLGNSDKILREKKEPEIPVLAEPSFMLTIQLLEKELKERERKIKELEEKLR